MALGPAGCKGGRGAREGCNSGEGEGGAKWGGARGEGEANRERAVRERAVLSGRSCGDEGGAKGQSLARGVGAGSGEGGTQRGWA